MQAAVPNLSLSRYPALAAGGGVAADEPAPVFAAELAASDPPTDEPRPAAEQMPLPFPGMAPLQQPMPDLAGSFSEQRQPQIALTSLIDALPERADPVQPGSRDLSRLADPQSPTGEAGAITADWQAALHARAPASVEIDRGGSLTPPSPDQVVPVPGSGLAGGAVGLNGPQHPADGPASGGLAVMTAATTAASGDAKGPRAGEAVQAPAKPISGLPGGQGPSAAPALVEIDRGGSLTPPSPDQVAPVPGSGLAGGTAGLSGPQHPADGPASGDLAVITAAPVAASGDAKGPRAGEAVQAPARPIGGLPGGQGPSADARPLAGSERFLPPDTHAATPDRPTDRVAVMASQAGRPSGTLTQSAAADVEPAADGAAVQPMQGKPHALAGIGLWRSQDRTQPPASVGGDPSGTPAPLAKAQIRDRSSSHKAPPDKPAPIDQMVRQGAVQTAARVEGDPSEPVQVRLFAPVASGREGPSAAPRISAQAAAPATVVPAEPGFARALPLLADRQERPTQDVPQFALAAQGDAASLMLATAEARGVVEPYRHPTAQETALRMRWASDLMVPVEVRSMTDPGLAGALPEKAEQDGVPDRKLKTLAAEPGATRQNDGWPFTVAQRQHPPMMPDAPVGSPAPVGRSEVALSQLPPPSRKDDGPTVPDQRHSRQSDAPPLPASGAVADEVGSLPMLQVRGAVGAVRGQGTETDRLATARHFGEDRLPEGGGVRGSPASDPWDARAVQISSGGVAVISSGSAPAAGVPAPDPLTAQRGHAAPAASGNAASSANPPADPAQQAGKALAQLSPLQPGRIELTLTPETLGRVHFDMQPDGAGLSITLSAERQDTLELMRRHLPDLMAELRQAGVQAGTLSFGTWSEGRHAPQPAKADPEPAFMAQAEAPRPPLQTASRPASARGLDMRL